MKSKLILLAIVVSLSACVSGASVAVSPTPIDLATLETPVPNEGRSQVPAGMAIVYQSNPPASGPSYPDILQYGLYEQAVAEGFWVRTLERGGVVFLYRCDVECSALKQELGDLLDTVPLSKHGTVKLVIAPYTHMDHLITAVAWDVQLPLDRFDAKLLTAFYTRHVDQGPEDAP